MLNRPFWDQDRSLEGPQGLPSRADIVVIGTGVVGLSCAYGLASSGASVVALDRGPAGVSALSGVVHAGFDGSIAMLTERIGPDPARSLAAATYRAVESLHRLITSQNIECDYRRTGLIHAFASRAEANRATRDTAALAEMVDVDLQLLEPEDEDAFGIEGFRGGILDPTAATLDVGRFVAALTTAATTFGALVAGHTEVRHIERKTTGYQLLTNRGKLSAQSVVLATSGHSGPLVRHVQRRVVPRASHLYALDTDAPDAPTIAFSRGPIVRRSGVVIVEDRSDPAGGSDAEDRVAAVLDDVDGRLPELEAAEPTHGWTVRHGHAFDGFPHIGEFDGMHYVVGQGHRDLPVGVDMGMHVAELLGGARTDSPYLAATAPGRWWYRGDPWFLNVAGRMRAGRTSPAQ